MLALNTHWYDSEEIDALLALQWSDLHRCNPGKAEQFLIFRVTPWDQLRLSLFDGSALVTLRALQDLTVFYPDASHRPTLQKPWQTYDCLIFPISVAQDMRINSLENSGYWNHYALCILMKVPALEGYYAICYQDSLGLESEYLQPQSCTALSLAADGDIVTTFSEFLRVRNLYLAPIPLESIQQQMNDTDCGPIVVHNVRHLFNEWVGQLPIQWPAFPPIARNEQQILLQTELPYIYDKLLRERLSRAEAGHIQRQNFLAARSQPASQVESTVAPVMNVSVDDIWVMRLRLLQSKRLDIEIKHALDKLDVLGNDLFDISELAKSLSVDEGMVKAQLSYLTQFENDLEGYIQARANFLAQLERFSALRFDKPPVARPPTQVLVARKLRLLFFKAIFTVEDVLGDFLEIQEIASNYGLGDAFKWQVESLYSSDTISIPHYTLLRKQILQQLMERVKEEMALMFKS